MPSVVNTYEGADPFHSVCRAVAVMRQRLYARIVGIPPRSEEDS